MTPIPGYVFKAEYISNYDGDTLLLRLDHGKFPTSKACTECDIRVKDLWCPELSEPGGIEAREVAAQMLKAAERIVVQTYKGSFARTVADVWVDDQLFGERMAALGVGRFVRI
jgi:endonuclease YncB( thermonuclease family)